MQRTERLTVLAGGVGAARFLRGLRSHLDPGSLSVIVNTADDDTFFGLHVSPDIDTVIYTLAGVVDPAQGWGVRGDAFRCLVALQRYYEATWFRLGDADLATHIFRTEALRRGHTLTTVTAALARAHGVDAHVLPMSDAPVRTFVEVAGKGLLPFQEYLVHGRGRGRVRRIVVRRPRGARPTTAALAAVRLADRIILPPSNPLVSIGPILGLRGMRLALRTARARVAAISPLIGGRPVKGPLHRMLRGLGHEVSPVGVARLYRGLADIFVLDRTDAALAPRIAALGMRPVVTDTLMSSEARSRRLAKTVLAELRR
jgi:LPPG:FO 2-phospho-L-lactate transferase